MQILAEAEDLPKTANIKTQLNQPVDRARLRCRPADRVPGVPGIFPADVAGYDRRAGREVLQRPHGDDPVQHDHVQPCGVMLLPFFMVIVVQMKRMATQSHSLRLLLPHRGGQRRNLVRARRHLLSGRGVSAGPQPRAVHAAQRHGLDDLHRAGGRIRRA